MSEPGTAEPKAGSSLPKPAPRRRWLPWVLSAAIFLCGCVVGAGAALLLVRKEVLKAVHHPELAPAKIAGALRRHLGLSDSQAEAVEQILRKHQATLQSIRSEAQPRVEAILGEVESDIAQVLDTDQQEKWHARVKRLRELWLPPMPPRK